MRCAVLGLTVLLAVTGCATAPAAQPAAVQLTMDGKKLADASELQATAEAQLAYTLDYGYVARAGAAAVSCWFAKTGLESEVDKRLWCGPVQVPGTGASTDWVPVPLKEVTKTDDEVRYEVQSPQVPEKGNRSTPSGTLVRTDGKQFDPSKQQDLTAGRDFLAVLPDDGKRSNHELGLGDADIKLRDDLLGTAVTGWANPDIWFTSEGTLRAETGSRLRVVRMKVEKLNETDSGFHRTNWQGFAPQPSELALEVPGKRQVLPADRLPASGSVFVVYTVPDPQEGAEHITLGTLGAKSLEQRAEVPSGKRADTPPQVLTRASAPAQFTEQTQKIRFNDRELGLKITGVRLGRQRPVKLGESQYDVATISAPDKALLEVRIEATGDLPDTAGGLWTKDLITVTLPDGSAARQVGARYDGGPLPFAIVVEVPADTRSVSVGMVDGLLDLPRLGKTTIAPVDSRATLALEF
ncbi:hypothetical protein DFR72_104158 [Lentzea flaviverrucosa]|uniref:Lipoprotein n=1 Tax=Lentzea flaviverrucosa TaxID=200379 RepID=A0A1H9MQD7_9PSEU|nr:hypothetical protein DFR72_104158 [Lentzea flaviverrucosa]SER25906.1 hypothetical protein SAMN05216195_104469 [Lentzea flaviverrucosa]